jgi:hypothetical protein
MQEELTTMPLSEAVEIAGKAREFRARAVEER